ncbi:helix-turn-helix domain-containing protein [Fusobacterium gonidiaformans]|uniref:helix-turn-helix domain-containing protein n=1 Tax=Fusobacterium gonidiaformans TaxID=849 RepID=UPI0023F2180C|nr:helix-turn-helix domain-containing protein [Fusobacterium gonidiaformans]
MDNRTIGEIIKSCRKEKGITQEELANKVNRTKQTIFRYENNETDISANALKQIAKVLGVSPSYLMGFSDDELEQDEVIANYKLTDYELLEYNKILNMNILMFNADDLTEETKQKLQESLKSIFVRALLERRKKNKK